MAILLRMKKPCIMSTSRWWISNLAVSIWIHVVLNNDYTVWNIRLWDGVYWLANVSTPQEYEYTIEVGSNSWRQNTKRVIMRQPIQRTQFTVHWNVYYGESYECFQYLYSSKSTNITYHNNITNGRYMKDPKRGFTEDPNNTKLYRQKAT